MKQKIKQYLKIFTNRNNNFIPINMSLGLKKDLHKRELTQADIKRGY